MDTIRQRLEGDDHRAYLQAVRELPTLPRGEIAQMLWDIAQSHTGRVQARMMNPLREFDPELANRLALQILDTADATFHEDALYTLWKTKSVLGVAKASEMLVSHPEATVRLWSAIYLGMCGTNEQIRVLQQALTDHGVDEEGREVCKVAEAAIAEIVDREGNSRSHD